MINTIRKVVGRIHRILMTRRYERSECRCELCGHPLDLNAVPALRYVCCEKCACRVFVPLKVGRFWLYAFLGNGAMGNVYKATASEGWGKIYAVKLLPSGSEKSRRKVQALKREAGVVAAVGAHPRLVELAEAGWSNQRYYYAMQYIAGERLDNFIRKKGALERRRVCDLMLQILEAEKCLYQNGYLYRDLKPENIIFDKKGNVRLVDYGLTVDLNEAAQPQSKRIHGSPYYMPPERLNGVAEDACSEIYSLGMIMYYALVGERYIKSIDLNNVVQRHVTPLRIPVEAKLRWFPEDIVWVVSRMMAPNPRQRYQDFKTCERALRWLKYHRPAKRQTVPRIIEIPRFSCLR